MENICNLSFAEVVSRVRELGEPDFRAKQIWQWIWQKGVTDFASMTNIGKGLRSRLSDRFSLQLPRIHTRRESADGTCKLLLALEDGELIETVLIPERDHFTLCLSTQVGCPLGCTFCSTGQMGFRRNLTAGEILGQILVARQELARREHPFPLRNLVFMGMGEPLLNWPEVQRSLAVIRDPAGLDFSHRRVTLSTVGIPERLEEFMATGQASLAISLHASSQAVREQIMPAAARLCSIEELVARLGRLPLKPRQRITVEYLLIQGVNDSIEQAVALNRLLSFIPCKINLIACNTAPDLGCRPPDQDRVLAFEQLLWSKGKTATLRKSKGTDIQAACGQLKSTSTKGQTAPENA
jgi:23S rRNA (adenine2503-C2)-methyltransferase